MSDGGLTVVQIERDEPALPAALASLAGRVVVAPHARPDDTRLLDDAGDVLWLPAWARVDDAVLAAIAAWRAAGRTGHGPRAACTRLRLCAAGATVLLPQPRVVLSSGGGARLVGDRPLARPDAALEHLAEPWSIDLPATLSQHVRAMNEQTSITARLRGDAGLVASWRDLTLRPAAFLARALAATRGSRRAALPRIVIESYREVLVAAKLWERTQQRSAAT